MIAYQANDVPAAPEQMYVCTSTDDVTWTARQKISVASASVNNAFPALAAHPTTAGDFRVAWQDDRIASANGFLFPYGDHFEIPVSPDGWNHVIWGEGTICGGPDGCWYTRGQ